MHDGDVTDLKTPSWLYHDGVLWVPMYIGMVHLEGIEPPLSVSKTDVLSVERQMQGFGS